MTKIQSRHPNIAKLSKQYTATETAHLTVVSVNHITLEDIFFDCSAQRREVCRSLAYIVMLWVCL